MEREILDAAWALLEREGVAELSAREVARSVGLRQQSLTYYYRTKQDLLDALFADGFADLRGRLDDVRGRRDPIASVIAVAKAVAEYCAAHPARYHLMFQRTVPGFRPSAASHAVALSCLRALTERLDAVGITDPNDVALVRGLISGLASEQIANAPGGQEYVGQIDRGMRFLLGSMVRR